MNFSEVNYSDINACTKNYLDAAGGEEFTVIPNCFLLENYDNYGTVGAWLWEDDSPILLENNTILETN